MNTWIALLRGINVGGANRLTMQSLVDLLAGIGLQDVRTYIQSGNVVFRSDRSDAVRIAADIASAIAKNCGFEPQVQVLSRAELSRAMAANPFPEAEAEPKSVHVYFLDSVPERPDLDALTALKAERERYLLKGRFFYLHAPDGIGRSKLAARAERLLGVSATARNWRTLCRLAEMSGAHHER